MPYPAIPPPVPDTRPPLEPVYGDPYADGQAALRGLLLDPASRRMRLMRMAWYGIQRVREQDEPRAGLHGVWAGEELLGALQIPVTVRISARTAANAHRLLAALTAAWAPSSVDLPLLYRMDGTTYLRWVRPRLVDVDTSRLGAGESLVRLGCVATDPAYYSADLVTEETQLPAPGGGVTPPLTPPLVLPPRPGGGRIIATNAGTWDTAPVITMRGPWTDPGVSYSDGRRVQYQLTLAAGQALTVDTATGVASLAGGALRSPMPGSTVAARMLLPPGATTIRMLGTTPVDATMRPTLTVAWRHAYL